MCAMLYIPVGSYRGTLLSERKRFAFASLSYYLFISSCLVFRAEIGNFPVSGVF